MRENKERNYLIDNLKVVLMLMVVFGHVIEYYIKSSDLLMGIYIFIYLFHMPLFVFISGYFSKNVEKCRVGILKSLLIPYVFFNIVWYVIASIWTGEFIFSLFNPGWTLWYLISLFIWRLLIKYLSKIKYIIAISILGSLIISIIPNSYSLGFILRTVTFLPFFLIGYFTKERTINNIKSINKGFSFGIIVLFVGVSYFITINNLLNYKFFYNSQSYYDTGLSTLEGMIFRGLLYIAAIVLGICIINITPKSKLLFTGIAKSTMNIYVFHIYLVVLLYGVIPKWNMGVIRNILLLTSPLLIMYILSKKPINTMYIKIFNPINNIVYPKTVEILKKVKKLLGI